LSPTPAGDGRALAFDPATRHLFYTNLGDPHIYVIDTSGSAVATLNPVDRNGQPISYASLSWDARDRVLWAGRYDGSGEIDKVDPLNGAVSPQFNFAFPSGDSCYGPDTGYVDGLAFDASDNTLWIGDDNARTLFHVKLDGTTLNSYRVPNGRCRTGIAVSSRFLWMGLQSGPDQPPFDIIRVTKSNPTKILSSFSFGTAEVPEGLALDPATFSGKCAVWSNQTSDGSTTSLTAWESEPGECAGNSPPHSCVSSRLHGAFSGFGVSFASYQPTPAIPVKIMADASPGDITVCTARVFVVNTPAPGLPVSLFISKQNQGPAEFGFELRYTPPPTWSGKNGVNPRPASNLRLGDVQVQLDPSTIVDVTSRGLSLPLAKISAPPIPTILLDDQQGHFLQAAAAPVVTISASIDRDWIRRMVDQFRAPPGQLPVWAPLLAAQESAAIAAGIEKLPQLGYLPSSLPRLLDRPSVNAAFMIAYISFLSAFESRLRSPLETTVAPVVLILGGLAAGAVALVDGIGGIVECAKPVSLTCPVAMARVRAPAKLDRVLNRYHTSSLPLRDRRPPRAKVERLSVAHINRLDTRTLVLHSFPAQFAMVTHNVVPLPVEAEVHPLLIRRGERALPGHSLTLVAVALPDEPHPVLFILQGPRYRAERLVMAAHGVAGGRVTLPRHMSPGQWTLAVQDLSGLSLNEAKQIIGRAQVRLGTFTIRRGQRPLTKLKVSTIRITGTPSSPTIAITGVAFASKPTPTNLALTGYTGFDYGNDLYFCDQSDRPQSFCAGQNDGLGHGADTIGLVVTTYTDTAISYTLGSAYVGYYYPANVYKLNVGDSFTVHVKGVTCSGTVDFSGQPIRCR
jgi:hypothetical protein